MSNWGQRPLTTAQVEYAALDAFALHTIYTTLMADEVVKQGALPLMQACLSDTARHATLPGTVAASML